MKKHVDSEFIQLLQDILRHVVFTRTPAGVHNVTGLSTDPQKVMAFEKAKEPFCGKIRALCARNILGRKEMLLKDAIDLNKIEIRQCTTKLKKAGHHNIATIESLSAKTLATKIENSLKYEHGLGKCAKQQQNEFYDHELPESVTTDTCPATNPEEKMVDVTDVKKDERQFNTGKQLKSKAKNRLGAVDQSLKLTSKEVEEHKKRITKLEEDNQRYKEELLHVRHCSQVGCMAG